MRAKTGAINSCFGDGVEIGLRGASGINLDCDLSIERNFELNNGRAARSVMLRLRCRAVPVVKTSSSVSSPQ
jgi:hypothetical protein